jgi:hypothetical protein
MSSKPKQKDSNEGHESVSSKVARFSQLNLIPGGMKPSTPTSPTGGISPMSLPTSAIHSKRDSFKEDESGEFNAIERGEKLSHLTAGRVRTYHHHNNKVFIIFIIIYYRQKLHVAVHHPPSLTKTGTRLVLIISF